MIPFKMFCTNCQEIFQFEASNSDLHVVVCPGCSKIQGAIGRQELVDEWKDQGGPIIPRNNAENLT